MTNRLPLLALALAAFAPDASASVTDDMGRLIRNLTASGLRCGQIADVIEDRSDYACDLERRQSRLTGRACVNALDSACGVEADGDGFD